VDNKLEKGHLIIITRGREDGGMAATQGLELAVTLQAMNYQVSIFLTLGGTRWAYQETGVDIKVPGHLCLEEYFTSFAEQDGELLVCSPCVAAYCHLPSIPSEDLNLGIRDGAEYVGMATVAERLCRINATVF
jgi:predicted peroxiredoxin